MKGVLIEDQKSVMEREVMNIVEDERDTKRRKIVEKEGRFIEKINSEDEKQELKVSLVINLFENGFSFQNQDTLYPYNHTTQGFLTAIDNEILTSSFLELLGSSTLYFYEGCLLVEIHDYRNSKLDINLGDQPIIKKVLLQPTGETFIKDIEQIIKSNKQLSSPEDAIAIEQQILLSKDICLDPSVNVCLVMNEVMYQRRKNNIKLNRRRASVTAQSQAETRIPKSPNNFALLKHINEYNELKDSQTPSFAVKVHQAVNHAIQQQASLLSSKIVESNISPTLLSQNINPLPPFVNTLHNRRLTFHGNSGKAFCFFQVLPKRSGGYEGVIRVGKTPDIGTNGEIIRFPLGTAEEAERFITQMKIQYEKEGFGVLVYDSLIHGQTFPPDVQGTSVTLTLPNSQTQSSNVPTTIVPHSTTPGSVETPNTLSFNVANTQALKKKLPKQMQQGQMQPTPNYLSQFKNQLAKKTNPSTDANNFTIRANISSPTMTQVGAFSSFNSTVQQGLTQQNVNPSLPVGNVGMNNVVSVSVNPVQTTPIGINNLRANNGKLFATISPRDRRSPVDFTRLTTPGINHAPSPTGTSLTIAPGNVTIQNSSYNNRLYGWLNNPKVHPSQADSKQNQ